MSLQLRNVDVGNDAADHDQHVVQPLLLQQLHHARTDVHVRAGQDRQADHVGVLLQRGGDDLLGRLAQAGVDDLHAGVAQRARDHLRAAVVPVEPGLGDDDSDFAHTSVSFSVSVSYNVISSVPVAEPLQVKLTCS